MKGKRKQGGKKRSNLSQGHNQEREEMEKAGNKRKRKREEM